jgi:hypothetical protein
MNMIKKLLIIYLKEETYISKHLMSIDLYKPELTLKEFRASFGYSM